MSIKTKTARFINAPLLFWALLSLPGLYWLLAYWLEIVFYGEFIHLSGDFAVQLLIVTLAVTPLRRVFPQAGWVRWLVRRRRYLGVASFAYGFLHTLVYLQRKVDPALIIDEAKDIGMWTGWLALAIMLLLAVTSNNYSVRRLKRKWQLLHRTVYAATVLIFAHWILTAFDPATAYWHLAVLLALLIIRTVFGYWRGSLVKRSSSSA